MTTIHVSDETLERLNEAKPFPSISHNDLVNHLLDVAEAEGHLDVRELVET